jgi:exodeoxyribonuclease V beta subunit
MTDINNFDLLNSTLEGTNLIEASAGTGKTYTITGLFLRLVLEKHLSVSRILVVTFTEAATGELKERIRNHLREAIRAFSEGGSQDPFLMDLSNKMNDAEKALTHLKEALREFDQASIFTIHGFCKRMLQENAFESGSLFDTELVTDQENLKREIVDAPFCSLCHGQQTESGCPPFPHRQQGCPALPEGHPPSRYARRNKRRGRIQRVV